MNQDKKGSKLERWSIHETTMENSLLIRHERIRLQHVTKVMPSTASTTTILSNAQSGPILSPPVRMQGQPVTPRPVGASSFRPYVTWFTMPMSGRKQPYGMPTSMMANLHNSASPFTDPTTTIISPLQGSGLEVNNLGQTT